MNGGYNRTVRFKQVFNDAVRFIFAVSFLVSFLFLIGWLSNRINCLDCPQRLVYEGKIIDKSMTFSESNTGSRATRRLLIKPPDGTEFEIFVNQPVYERAKIGNLIKSSKEGVKISEDSQK